MPQQTTVVIGGSQSSPCVCLCVCNVIVVIMFDFDFVCKMYSEILYIPQLRYREDLETQNKNKTKGKKTTEV